MNRRNHPNRRTYDLKPTPEKVAKARKDVSLSQEQAGALVHVGAETWRCWESDVAQTRHRPMPLAAWELFQRKVRAIVPMSDAELKAWESGSDSVAGKP